MGLVEVIAALGISVVVITSLLSLTLFSLRTSLTSSLLMEGTKAANVETELIRAYRDSIDWDTFSGEFLSCTDSSVGCHIDKTSLKVTTGYESFVSSGVTVTTGFYVTDSDTNIIHVTVKSSWDIGGQTKNTYVYTDFTNWQKK